MNLPGERSLLTIGRAIWENVALKKERLNE